MSSEKPKQYCSIGGKTILEWTLSRFMNEKWIEKIIVVLHPNDVYWKTLNVQSEKIALVEGGDVRSESVFNALKYLEASAEDQDWVLVHDAVRPLINMADVHRLVEDCENHEVGGILGMPSRSTLKQVDHKNLIEKTVDRSQIWEAQTPQMFRFGLLKKSLEVAINSSVQMTDEASALENAGYTVKMVRGSAHNLKITYPEDLHTAECLFNQREKSLCE